MVSRWTSGPWVEVSSSTTLGLYTRRTEDPTRILRALDDVEPDDPDDGPQQPRCPRAAF